MDVLPPLSLSAILGALAGAGVEFVVCGGLACVAHGVARTTADLGCFVRLERDNLLRLVGAMTPLGFRLRAPEPIEALADEGRRRAWIEEKQALAATLVSPRTPLQVDVFLHYPVPFDELLRESVRADVAGIPVRISSMAHLVRAKREVVPQRVVDRRDIEDLQELMRHERCDR